MLARMANADRSVEFIPGDLASGDGKSLELASGDLDVVRIQSSDDPLFATAFERLWAEFGEDHTMEARDIIVRRLAWHPAAAVGNCRLRYEMLLVQRQGGFVAVRDHTAVVVRRGDAAHAVVHLSHVLVDPRWRRTGLAGWLRAWPVQTARACLAAAGVPAAAPITLVAEMEHPDAQFPNRMIRLKAYEKAGFKKVDPSVVKYFQPDFRPPAEIDASGKPRPLPFGLILRRLGREQEQTAPGSEIHEIVHGLYQMYGTGFREQDMAGLWGSLREYPAADARIALGPPTQ
jgi:GNAT superfamily N-acetyltransferase